MFDSVVEAVAKAVLPSIICPILRDTAGPGCRSLKRAIYLNEDLLEAYKQADEGKSWGYANAKKVARQYPNVADMITPDIIIQWLKEEDMMEIVHVIEGTTGGKYWLEQQVLRFKSDLFGV
ncbi:MAG: hypothetical protein M0R06_20920 [Sphaerochaeta sp.]|nr:hypothetical protein [Sphaerochaeta sp.]